MKSGIEKHYDDEAVGFSGPKTLSDVGYVYQRCVWDSLFDSENNFGNFWEVGKLSTRMLVFTTKYQLSSFIPQIFIPAFINPYVWYLYFNMPPSSNTHTCTHALAYTLNNAGGIIAAAGVFK